MEPALLLLALAFLVILISELFLLMVFTNIQTTNCTNVYSNLYIMYYDIHVSN